MNDQKLETVLRILKQRGCYRQQPQLVTVAEVDFQFDAIFRGPGDNEALVIVLRATEEQLASVVSKVRALSHTMLRSGSTRPLTLVMLIEKERSPLVDAVSRICRVVPVTATEEEPISVQLLSLLPIALPEPQKSQPDAGRQLRAQLGKLAETEFVSSLLAAGRKSEKDVQEELASAIEAAIDPSSREGTEDA